MGYFETPNYYKLSQINEINYDLMFAKLTNILWELYDVTWFQIINERKRILKKKRVFEQITRRNQFFNTFRRQTSDLTDWFVNEQNRMIGNTHLFSENRMTICETIGKKPVIINGHIL